MPTYEYICDACGNEFEKFASMSAPPEKKCPKCKKNKVHRKISSGGGIIFKGGGFYETDYRGDAYKKAADAEKGGGDTKPAETKAADTKAAETATPATADAKPTTSDEKPKVEAKPVAPKPPPPPAAKSSSSKTRKR